MTAPRATGHTTTDKGELNWLLDDLVDRVASIRKAIVLSGDGLPTGASKDLTREDSEHLAAVGDGSCLAVLADADSDVGQVAYEMTLLVKRVGVHLGAAPRTDLPSGG